MQGKLKSSKKLASELSFDFCIESVGKSLSVTELDIWGLGLFSPEGCVDQRLSRSSELTETLLLCALVYVVSATMYFLNFQLISF